MTVIFVFWRIVRAYRKYRFRSSVASLADDQLPSISVCLPARNETGAMTECLEAVLASDYPKMEIIVVDDNSTDNTSYLIKAFAHAGVRFVQGGELPDGWLGKNFTLETLLHEASGKYIVFVDVDTRLDKTTLRQLINLMAAERLAMVSVVPQRYDMYRFSAWLSTLRYFWELVLDGPTYPGSSSATWVIDRHLLKSNLGGFGHWKDQVQPETYIASEMTKVDAYRLIASTPALGVSYAKKWSSQIETGRRLLLPRFYNSFASVFIGAGLLLSVALPPVIGIISWFVDAPSLFWGGAILSVLIAIVFLAYNGLVWRSKWWLSWLVLPYVIWQELFLLVSSTVGYRRGTITWKGRAVSRPSRT